MDVIIGCGEYHEIPFNIDAQLDHALWYLMTYVQEGKWDHSISSLRYMHVCHHGVDITIDCE